MITAQLTNLITKPIKMKNFYKEKVLIHGLKRNYFRQGILAILLLLAIGAQAQVVVQGTVRDEQGITLPGVSVLLKGTKEGTVTGADGKFSIKVPDGNAVLSFRYIGFTDQDFTVGALRNLNIVMKSSASNLDEVVVVGYGKQKK